MSAAMKEVHVLQELFDKESPKINLRSLAEFFGATQGDVAAALGMDATSVSRNPLAAPEGKVKTWLSIFNLLIEVITEAEPTIPTEDVKQKMKVWLSLPRPEFDGQTPLNYMLKGKSRKVRLFLEQHLG